MKIVNVVLSDKIENFDFKEFQKKLQEKRIFFETSTLNATPVLQVQKDNILFRFFKTGKVVIIIKEVQNIEILKEKIKEAEEFLKSLLS